MGRLSYSSSRASEGASGVRRPGARHRCTYSLVLSVSRSGVAPHRWIGCLPFSTHFCCCSTVRSNCSKQDGLHKVEANPYLSGEHHKACVPSYFSSEVRQVCLELAWRGMDP